MMHFTLALFVTVIQWMTSLVPNGDHSALAWAVASQSRSVSEAALVTAVAFRESSLSNEAVGDNGSSFCAMQIHKSSGGNSTLLESPEECIAKGLMMLRESVRIDRKNPVAFYARGPNWQSAKAKGISRDRVAIATRLLRGEKKR